MNGGTWDKDSCRRQVEKFLTCALLEQVLSPQEAEQFRQAMDPENMDVELPEELYPALERLAAWQDRFPDSMTLH